MLKTAKLICNEYKVNVQRILKCSVNEEARKLYEITTTRIQHIFIFTLIKHKSIRV